MVLVTHETGIVACARVLSPLQTRHQLHHIASEHLESPDEFFNRRVLVYFQALMLVNQVRSGKAISSLEAIAARELFNIVHGGGTRR